ncbi:endolytic transglycosylase MltG [Hyphomicrobium sp.]|uniref:endolytic transglycosylase MltG n=1 Tax=Hyphomicrobium sp. TaxID=82 RepID=UPI002E330B0F|nr:endolytic transglycosylase MltG [Hyphomicrobium sp.]HEX2843062.1 endolytic transglycosylase MltG [Hyphomicrobium sp.]
MSKLRREVPHTLSRRDGVRPRSPAEALEPGRAPPRPHGARQRKESRVVSGLARVVSGIMTILLVAMLTVGGLTLLVGHLYTKPGPLTLTETVVVPKGASSNDIADSLEREGVVSSRWAFMVNYLVQSRMHPGEISLKAGEYLFKPGVSIREVMEILSDGKSVLYKVTIPEGLTSQQIVERLKGEENLTGEVTQIPAEGSLLPETYSIEKGMARQELLDRMQLKQKQVLEAAWTRRQAALPFENAAQAVVMASIIEKETGRADERERIAGVFVNRLKKGMPLQSDPTILYGIYGGGVSWGKPILQSEKDTKNAHNTYQIKGLPPTPICNPGRPALEAALNPSEHGDLFFVADGTGGHIFTATLKDHNAAVANWRKMEKEIRARQAAAGKDVPAGTAAGGQAKNPVAEIPNPPAEDAAAEAPATADASEKPAAPTAASASAIPPPIRKPKKQ